MILMRRNQTT